MRAMELPELTLRPIGVVHSPHLERASAPRQPRAATGVRGTIELLAGQHFEDALSDLVSWEYIWVIFWFHLNHGWRPKVLPPRSDTRRGLFATRTPHRPNPIGISVLRLEAVDGLTLRVSDLDLLDGTPVLDIKPYVPWADAIPDAGTGWLEAPTESAGAANEGPVSSRPEDPRAQWEVRFAPLARAQIDFLAREGIELEHAIAQVLSLGPQPHAYRRIRLDNDGSGRLALKEWRARFRADGRVIEVLAIESGYRTAQLADETPALRVHRAFVQQWGREK